MVAKGDGFRGGMEWQVGVRRYKLYRMDCLSNMSRRYVNPIYLDYIHYIYSIYQMFYILQVLKNKCKLFQIELETIFFQKKWVLNPDRVLS